MTIIDVYNVQDVCPDEVARHLREVSVLRSGAMNTLQALLPDMEFKGF
ncbi:hypothetical protein [Spongiibacter marinus]|nr:hypothetical protein [Spongiibacter marinus]MBM7424589.1 hypothetical protein [Spongiibacter marinus]MEE2652190.1 hypothetical protein [Pseudomonadota bacterium]